MDFDITPFTAADGLLVEASGWLNDMTLPLGHPDRHENDGAVCLAQAADNIGRAIALLQDHCKDQVVVEDAGGDESGVVLREVIVDQQAFDASELLEKQFGGICAWHRGGLPVALSAQLVEAVKGFIASHFGARLESERRTVRALADVYDY